MRHFFLFFYCFALSSYVQIDLYSKRYQLQESSLLDIRSIFFRNLGSIRMLLLNSSDIDVFKEWDRLG